MKFYARIGVGLLVLAHFFVAPPVWGQSVGDDVPDVEGVDLSGLATATRRVDKTYPISNSPSVSIENKYGAISVSTWPNPLVRVVARIRVGAETRQAAERFSQAIEVLGNHVGDRVEIRTVYPVGDAPDSLGYSVDLEVKVPAETELTMENVFGDCHVQDLRGDVAVDSRYGVVTLSNLSGNVRVRAKGAFPLTARKLTGGGSFTLRSTQATFDGIAGVFEVNNYLGSIRLQDVGDVLDADITCESGPIHLVLPIGAEPMLEASTRFGDIQSDFVWPGESWGDVTRVETPYQDSTQKLSLYSSFDTIFIHREISEAAPEPLVDTATAPIKQVVTSTIPIDPASDLVVDATVGRVEIVGIDDPSQVIVQATRYVRISETNKAQMALEGLAFRLDNENGTVRVRSMVQEDMKALGCTEYRIDLHIQLPQGISLRVMAERGDTVVRNTEGGLTLEQAEGTVLLESNGGVTNVTNLDGNVTILGATGPITTVVNGGVLRIEKPVSDIDVTSRNGKTIIDTPQAGVSVTSESGDVRVIALEGVHGDFQIVAVDGNISVAIPSTADASLFLNAKGGTVYSSIAISGTIEGHDQSYQGRMNEGTHRIILETDRGNIVLD